MMTKMLTHAVTGGLIGPGAVMAGGGIARVE